MLAAEKSITRTDHELIDQVRRTMGDPIDRILFVDNLLKYGAEENFGFFLSSKWRIPSSVTFEKRYTAEQEIPLSSFEPCNTSLHELMFARKSAREYTKDPVSMAALSALLTYGYGIRKIAPSYNHPRFSFRTAPSAGGLQGTELYLIVNRVGGLKQGLYHFNAHRNSIEPVFEGILQGKLRKLCAQEMVAEAGAVLLLTMMMQRGIWKYLSRYYKFALVDAGCVVENLHLVATALGLGSCIVAALDQDGFANLLQLERHEIPVLLLTVGMTDT
ncbi:MAG: SagB/ThcOx family dehydrogenase [Ignavibacteria bacterium]|nr:SagB/ThcOx family dehydrogenase [Ignavibacteria bacterium]